LAQIFLSPVSSGLTKAILNLVNLPNLRTCNHGICRRKNLCSLKLPLPMLELEVYAAGVRDLNKILELDHELEAVAGLRYKVDSNHDLVYLEIDDDPSITFREIRAIFRRLGLDPRFVGAIPPELRPRSKTQLLGV